MRKNKQAFKNTVLQVVTITLACLSFCSCVSLKTPKRADLVPLNAPRLIGSYPTKVAMEYVNNKDTLKNDRIIWYHFKDDEGKDSVELKEATHFEIRLIDNKHVQSVLYNGDRVLKTSVAKGRLRKGYFRFKGSVSLSGIPPFCWAMESNKSQFGLGKNGQLFIDAADETDGGILIIMAGTPGFTYSVTVPVYRK